MRRRDVSGEILYSLSWKSLQVPANFCARPPLPPPATPRRPPPAEGERNVSFFSDPPGAIFFSWGTAFWLFCVRENPFFIGTDFQVYFFSLIGICVRIVRVYLCRGGEGLDVGRCMGVVECVFDCVVPVVLKRFNASKRSQTEPDIYTFTFGDVWRQRHLAFTIAHRGMGC